MFLKSAWHSLTAVRLFPLIRPGLAPTCLGWHFLSHCHIPEPFSLRIPNNRLGRLSSVGVSNWHSGLNSQPCAGWASVFFCIFVLGSRTGRGQCSEVTLRSAQGSIAVSATCPVIPLHIKKIGMRSSGCSVELFRKGIDRELSWETVALIQLRYVLTVTSLKTNVNQLKKY